MGRLIWWTAALVWCQVAAVGSSAQGRRGGGRTCVVGAGVAGLSVAKTLQDAGQQFTVLEGAAHVGGTWHYEPRVGSDEYGRPILTSMYRDLRTNVPRQLMELPGFPMRPETPSFPNRTTYYQYVQDFTDHYNLRQYINLLHEVVLISRLPDCWRVVYREVPTGAYYEQYFDFVILCVGHNSKPKLPHIPGENIFKGSIIHSHDYRVPEPYINRRVLVVGSGPSGMDLVTTFTNCSSYVLHSHHSDRVNTPFPGNYVHKPDVVQFTEDGVLFRDGTYEKVDDVIYATGYEFYFPFLDESCGLMAQPTYLAPLYNYVVNVHHPSMLVVGLFIRACSVITTVLQAQYAAMIASGHTALPPPHAMFREWTHKAEAALAAGRPGDLHALTIMDSIRYYDNVTAAAGLPRVPPVLTAVCQRDNKAKSDNFYTFREYEYSVLDEEHFSRVYRPRHKCGGGLREHVNDVPVVRDI